MSDPDEDEEVFYCLTSAEQLAVRILLECAVLPRGNLALDEREKIGEWIRRTNYLFHSSIALGIYDKTAVVHLISPEQCGNCTGREDYFAGTFDYAVFLLRNSLCTSFAAFDFLFVRLFGGSCRPLTPSLFVAAALHPDVKFEAAQISTAIIQREVGWGKHEAVWSPN